MTCEELTQCDGFTVEVLIDGKEALAELSLTVCSDGPALLWPMPRGGLLQAPLFPPLLLSDADIDSLRPNGPGNLSSTIRISRDIPGNRLFEYSEQPSPTA